MKKLLTDVQRCKSCALCVEQCSKGALSMGEELNKAGYKHVVVDFGRCIACALCYGICPDYVFSVVDEG